MKTKRNIVANFVSTGFTAALSIALVPIYIRYLHIEAYGLVGMFAVIQVWMSLLDLGMAPTLSREMARYSAGSASLQFIRDLLRTLEITSATLGALIALVLIGGAEILATHWLRVDTLPIATVVHALRITGLVLALRLCEGIYRSALTGLHQMVWLNAASVILVALRGLGAVAVLAFVSPTIETFFLWQGLVAVITLIVLGAKLHTGLPAAPRRAQFSLPALREVRRFAGGMIGLSLMAVLLTQVDKLLLSRLLPLTQFAYFMLGSLVSSGLYMVVSPVVVAIFPTFVRLFSDDNEAGLAAAYHKASQLVTVLLAPITILLVAFPRGVLFAWSGDRVLADHTAPIMALLAVGTFLNGLIQVPHQLQLAAGWTSLALRMNLIAVVILIPALIWAVPHYGPVAAAAIWALLNGVYLLIGIPLLHRRMLKAEMRRWYVGDLIIPMCGAGAVVLLALVFQPQEAASRLAWLAFLIATGLVAVTGAVFCASELRPRAIEISTAMFEKYRWT